MNLIKNENLTMCLFDAHTTQPGDLSWDALEKLGSIEVFDRTAASEVLSRAAGKDILITNKVLLTRETFDQLPDCKLVCLLSTGTNAVDLAACRERGIPVCNIPAYSTDSVAELVFALLLAWARGVERHGGAVREGEWGQSPDFCFTLQPQRELRGRCLGLLGFGDIAQAVCRIAVAFGMQVIASTPHPENKPALGQTFVDVDTLFARADVLSLHCPLTDETANIINAAPLAKMKQGAVLINTGRGGLLDEPAVAAALASGQLGAALLDVLSTEPPKRDNPLLQAPNTLITPHIAWATREARGRLIEILCQNVAGFMKGELRNVVNGL